MNNRKHSTGTYRQAGRLILILLSILCTVLAVSACKHGETPTDTPKPVEYISLIENGKSLYRVVRSEYAVPGSDTVKAAVTLRKAINALCTENVEIVTDYEDKDNNAEIREILIGDTKREESQAVLAELGVNEYIIRVVNQKIVIVASSDEMLEKAVNRFIADYLKGEESMEKLQIEKDLSLRVEASSDQHAVIWATGENVPYVNNLATELKKECSKVTVYSIDTSMDEIIKTDPDILLIAGVERVPVGTLSSVSSYMENKGKLVLLGGPAFDIQVYESDGKWLTQSDYMMSIIRDMDETEKLVLWDTNDESIKGKLTRSSDKPKNRVTTTIDDYALGFTDCQLCYEIENFSSWDMLTGKVTPNQDTAYKNFGLYVRGSEDTDCIYIEMTDTEGCRWYVTATLTEEWQYRLFSSSDFRLYSGKPSKSTITFGNIVSMSIGLAQSGVAAAQGHHTLYYAEPAFLTSVDSIPEQESLVLDSVSPNYELYPVTNATKLETWDNQVFVEERNYTLPKELISCEPGRQGTGYNNARTSRFVPLIEAVDARGLRSGYAAWMHIFSSTSSNNGNQEGSVLACFSAVSSDFYDENGIAAIVDTVRAMLQPALLTEGGAEEYTYALSDTTEYDVGASLVQYYSVPDAILSVSLYKGEKLLKTVESTGKELSALSHNIATFTQTLKVSDGTPDRIVTTLTVGEKVVDRIEQDVCFWSPKPESERHYVICEDGTYKQNGKIVNLFGVNYMPSSGIAEQNGAYFEYYVGAAAYDPDVIRNDLLHIKDIGMNAVSIFVYASTAQTTNNMLDLIRICDELDLYVDLSLRPNANPVSNYNENEVGLMITKLHLAELDNLVAYDIAWEATLGQKKEGSTRAGWESDWLVWVENNYGSMAHAQELWGVNAESVTDTMLESNDKKYTAINAAYRRFIDEKVESLYTLHLNHMRSLDPNHLISFRMNSSGSGLAGSSWYCYDFQSLASSISFMAPEGYKISNAETALQIHLTTAYAQYCLPDAPVVWKEFGMSIWSGSNFVDNHLREDLQADRYEAIYENALLAHAGGMYCWYYAGGYRINEKSDFGIINPDGSDRPVTEVIRKYAPLFLAQEEPVDGKIEICVERDDYTAGFYALYPNILSKIKEAAKNGTTIELYDHIQNKPGDEYYADTVLDQAVGGTQATGQYPMLYVNGMVSNVRYDGNNVELTVQNVAHAAWRAKTVTVKATLSNGKTVDTVLTQDVAYLAKTAITLDLGDAAVEITDVSFEIEGHSFGNVFDSILLAR